MPFKDSEQEQQYQKEYYSKNSEKIKMRRRERYREEELERNAHYSRFRNYGLSKEDFENMLESQNNMCAICSSPIGVKSRDMAVDHCHNTGKIRGLLCTHCNRGLGGFRDDPRLIRKALIYLDL